MVKKQFGITSTEGLRPGMLAVWQFVSALVGSGKALKITVETKQRRSLEQNNKMWAMLADIASQVQWPVNGKMEWLRPEEWKIILTAATASELRMAAGVNGGFVFLGERTSQMSVRAMIDLIEFMYSFGSERCVRWSEPIPAEWFELMRAA